MPERSSNVGLGLARLAQVRRAHPVELPEFHLRPECLPVLGLWGEVQTQWRSGFSGPTGLDYAGVRASPAFRRLPRDEREDLFADLCVMERAWLAKRQQIAAEEAQRKANPASP